MQKSRYKHQFLIRFFFFLSFILVFPNISEAKHIIGGDMVYECNSNGTYNIILKLYRDCSTTDGAPYDDPAYFGIYNGSTLISQISQTIGASGQITGQISSHSAVPFNTSTIAPDDLPCVNESNPPCVQTATYRLTSVSLPFTGESYTIAYQRCCRNETITNIVAPGDTGATYAVTISPEAQQTCNNSPVFNDFPPILICAGLSIDFDHGATDAEGDSLVYSFCSPLKGGGLGGISSGNAFDFNGVAPVPPSSPPYNTVTFITPTFSSAQPMVGDPTIVINPETGFISGIPTTLGKFVVGICVEEYRNGVLIGEIQRDFQFVVIDCEPEVTADIEEDFTIGGNEFVINICGEFSHTFIDESKSVTDDTTYLWNFDFGDGTSFTSSDQDVFVTFPDLGTYQGTLVVNPGEICTDTAFIFVNVFPDITADFSFEYDTCDAGPVQFTDLSIAEVGAVETWLWDFGDGNSSNEQNPVYEYMSPGNFNISLTVTDINGCSDTATDVLSYFPAPESLVIDLDGFVGCAPETVFFDNLSFPIDTTYTIIWDFGDSTTSNEISPMHLYNESGIFNVSLDVISPIGCEVDVPYNATIEINDSPVAGFSFTPEILSNFQPEAIFTDESVDAAAWQWDFGDGSLFSNEQNPSHTYETGTYQVMQVVRHESGCLDTFITTIISDLLVTYHLPNAFTPNSDSKNEIFKGTGFLEGMTGFEMSIWNRWGEQIFLTNNPEQGWNGRKNNSGPILQNGVYVVLVKYFDPANVQITQKGFVTLIR